MSKQKMTYRYTKNEIIAAVQQCAVDVGGTNNKIVSVKQYRGWSSSRQVPKIYDIYRHSQVGSWQKALKLAKLYSPNSSSPLSSPQMIEDSIRQAVKVNGSDKPLSQRRYQEMYRAERGVNASLATVLRYFGSWTAAAEFVPFPLPQWEVSSLSASQVAATVKRVCGEIPMSEREYNRARQHSAPCAQRLALHFGGWQAVLKLAGFTEEEAAEHRLENITAANRLRFAREASEKQRLRALSAA